MSNQEQQEKELSEKIKSIGPSATLAVSNRSRELRAAGEQVISFGAGEPDFPTPEHIVEAAAEAARNPKWHKYSPAAGLPELQAAVAEKTLRDSGLSAEPSQIVITCGGKHAVSNAFQVLLNPGDEVIVIAPYWTTYPESVRLAGGVPVILETAGRAEPAANFIATPEDLEKVRTKKTKALVFVSPDNPTGTVYPREAIAAIGEWAAKNRLWVVADEIYEHLTYDGHQHHSLPVVVPEAMERCVVVNGVAKTYAMTGWRIGWMISPPAVAKAAAILQSHQTTNMTNVAQIAALAAVSGPLTAVEEMKAAFDRRRKTLHESLIGIPGVSCDLPQGAFYAFPSFLERLKSPVNGQKIATTAELTELILEEIKVAIVPGEAFGAPGYCRFSFALGDDDLKEGVGRLADFLSS